MTSEVASHPHATDCLPCRLISGFGLLTIGAYIYAQSKTRRKLEMHTMRLLSGGSVCLGIARLANVKLLEANKKT